MSESMVRGALQWKSAPASITSRYSGGYQMTPARRESFSGCRLRLMKA
jgi:hypothetical protein